MNISIKLLNLSLKISVDASGASVDKISTLAFILLLIN